MPDVSTTNQGTRVYTVNLQPIGRRVEVPAGVSLLEAAQMAGVELVSLCGGVGACDSCKIRLADGDLTPVTPEEEATFSTSELEAGFRLACQALPLSDVKVDIPPESLTTPQRLQVEGQALEVALDPAVRPVDVQIKPPDLYDLRGDTTRLIDALLEQGERLATGAPGTGATRRYEIAPELLGGLSDRLREHEWKLRVVTSGKRITSVLPSGQAPLGLAVDIGTTKLAGYLVSLESGVTLAKTGAMNPQVAYGEDVISRIAYANSHANGRRTLQARLVETLNQMVSEMCAQSGTRSEWIIEAVVVGNTAMHHLFAGLPVQQLGAAPYVPAVSHALDLPMHLIGLAASPGATVHLPPNIAGYVGADHVAMALATGAWETQRRTVALDIGTNTEITLAVPEAGGIRVLCCSCASGPAFEGAHIHDGMRAAPGAVERVQIRGDSVLIHTIGDLAPVGICGSGILDAVAQMLEARVVDYRGVLQAGHPLVEVGDREKMFVLAPAHSTGHGRKVIVNRRDVNEIQLAKGAIRAGIEILLAEAGLRDDDIEDFVVAGAFGTYIDIASAVRVGMFPDLPLERYHQVGNAAGAGARQMLVSASRRQLAQELSSTVEYIELSAHPDFTRVYSRSLFFPGRPVPDD